MKHDDGIDLGIQQNLTHQEIARKIYLCYPTKVFIDREEDAFDILNRISNHFQVQFTNVQVVGSSKTGFSYHQSREFQPGESDLDIAIIDSSLFLKYTQIAFKVTKRYRDLTLFKNTAQYQGFVTYLAKGMLRPDLMPRCKEKDDWFDFFNRLSSSYYKLFKSINGGIYADYFFFEDKQGAVVSQYRSQRNRKEQGDA